ncbi:unnamed protein product [Miscanthus lutarioriparius]|uniref:Uncharacterized protein n=1 Tax=Miscanthus lutarioriparius TaxID=422564 RepID=A0A811QD92_9POAL|nr:unnamed protein product [Miscanthus lutarioriparius]
MRAAVVHPPRAPSSSTLRAPSSSTLPRAPWLKVHQISSPEKNASTLAGVAVDGQDGGGIESGQERSLELDGRRTGISVDGQDGGGIKSGPGRSLDGRRTTSL